MALVVRTVDCAVLFKISFRNGNGKLLGETKGGWYANGRVSSRIILEWLVEIVYYSIHFLLQVTI